MRSMLQVLSSILALYLVIAPQAEAATLIPKGTLVRLRLEQTLSTKTNKTGEMVKLTAVEAIKLGKTTVIKKGALAQAQLEKVRGPGRFGRNGSIKIRYLFVTSARGKQIPIVLGERSIKANQSMGLAAGASAAGYIILGPIGVVGGAFVKGRHIDIPAGTELMVEVENDFVY
ncbi:MAG TPA: hypothetical protein PLP29_15750 [Candidatus Ozemobacteraceae bacterium]|nr:hypothetical protein [Candidatus Ozemobacteraceae bacterium]